MRTVNFYHASVDSDEHHDIQGCHCELHDKGLQGDSQQGTKLHCLKLCLHVVQGLRRDGGGALYQPCRLLHYMLGHVKYRHDDVEGVGEHQHGGEGLENPFEEYPGVEVVEVVVVHQHLDELTRKDFHAFVGEIARRDWQERHIMLPSVVIAQAAIESAVGTSELAQNANALFGIKLNGWTGRSYVKDATEQNPDGTYRIDKNELWRAYDSWEQSILDHNEYIATRSTDGGRTLRYRPAIGCREYALTCQYLQKCGYATSQSYAETLINYIEKYNLRRYDEITEED